jgi:hypothetical protein
MSKVQLRITGKFEIGNGYPCNCCRQTYEVEFEEYTFHDILQYLEKHFEFEEGDINCDPYDFIFVNLKSHHDQLDSDIRQYFDNKLRVLADYLSKKMKIKKGIRHATESLKNSNRFIAANESELKRHTLNVQRQTETIDELNKSLATLEESKP